jgi:hypothetical protein
MLNKINGARVAGAAAAAGGLGVFVVAALFLSGGVAGATSYNPTSGLEAMASTIGAEAGPIIIGVSVALIGLVMAAWGASYVLGWLRARRNHV